MNNKELVILAGKKQGGGSVTSVNGQTGAVVLTAADLDDSFKGALLNCFNHSAWTDEHGQDYVDALEAAMYPLSHITAVYTQSGTVYDTDSLDILKTDLVVTAVYEGGNTATVAAANYTLSGTLTAGTSTITVAYGGKTATFEVTVSTHVLYKLENRAFSYELIDSGVVLLGEDKDFSIAFDASITANPTSGNGSTPRFVSVVMTDGSGFSLALSKGTASASQYSLVWMGSYKQAGSVGTGRLRFVITHTKNSGSASVAIRRDTGSKGTTSVDVAFAASTHHLTFGQGTGNNMLPTGTINAAIIYDYAMSQAEIDAFLGL